MLASWTVAHACLHVSFVICSLALVLLLQRVALTPLAWIPATAWEWSFLLNINIYVNPNSEDLAFTLGFWILISLHCSQNKSKSPHLSFKVFHICSQAMSPCSCFLRTLQTPLLSGWCSGFFLLILFPSEWNAGTPISLRPRPTSSMKSS